MAVFFSCPSSGLFFFCWYHQQLFFFRKVVGQNNGKCSSPDVAGVSLHEQVPCLEDSTSRPTTAWTSPPGRSSASRPRLWFSAWRTTVRSRCFQVNRRKRSRSHASFEHKLSPLLPLKHGTFFLSHDTVCTHHPIFCICGFPVHATSHYKSAAALLDSRLFENKLKHLLLDIVSAIHFCRQCWGRLLIRTSETTTSFFSESSYELGCQFCRFMALRFIRLHFVRFHFLLSSFRQSRTSALSPSRLNISAPFQWPSLFLTKTYQTCESAS